MNRRLRTLRRRIENMPALEREVFNRARFRDLDYVQIAAELDLSVAEVERLMSSAMLYLMGWR